MRAAPPRGRPGIAFEGRRQPGAQQPRPGDRPLAVAPSQPVGRLDRLAPSRVVGREQPELLALAQVRGRHTQQPDPQATHLGPRKIERACLRSVLRQGHRLSLYCYEKPAGVPTGVIENASARRKFRSSSGFFVVFGTSQAALAASMYGARE